MRIAPSAASIQQATAPRVARLRVAALGLLGLLQLGAHAAGTPGKAPAAATAAPILAATLLPAQSEISFTARQMGVPVEGRFKRFEAQIRIDPKQPGSAQVQLNIDLSSATLGEPMFDAELLKPAWFDSKRQAQARFVGSQLKATGPGRFELTGQLDIKGQRREITLPISLSQAGGNSTATGSFVIRRLDFRIGDGEWADTSMVANDVQVKFRLTLQGVPAL